MADRTRKKPTPPKVPVQKALPQVAADIFYSDKSWAAVAGNRPVQTIPARKSTAFINEYLKAFAAGHEIKANQAKVNFWRALNLDKDVLSLVA